MNIKEYLQRNNNNLDLIRIVCASMVIIGHSYTINDPQGHQDLLRRLVGFTYSGDLAVKIFFFISGMLVTHSLLTKQSIASYSISRFFRLVPGLFFVLVITTFILGPLVSSFTASEYFSNKLTYKYFIDNMLYQDSYLLPGVFTHARAVGVNGSLWSLSYEVGCYLFLLGTFCLIRDNKIAANIFLLFIIADVLFKFNLLFGWLNLRTRYDSGIIRLCFAMGALLAVNQDLIKVNWKLPVGLAFFAIVFWHSSMNEIFFELACSLLFLVVAGMPFAKKITVKYDISYGMYLWGFVVQQFLYWLLGPINLFAFMFCSIYITSLMGFISFRLVEHPMMQYGKRLDKWYHENYHFKFSGLFNINHGFKQPAPGVEPLEVISKN